MTEVQRSRIKIAKEESSATAVMASTAEQEEECTHRSKRQQSEDIVQLPYEILGAIFCTLPTPVVVHRVGTVCKDWNAIVKDDELWRLRCGLSELPSGFGSWFAYDQRQTTRGHALDHLYGRAGVAQNWRKGLQLLSVLADAGDDYAMALYGWSLCCGVGIAEDDPRMEQLLQQSKHSMPRVWCLYYGIGVPVNFEAFFEVLNTECDTSDPHVQYMLAVCHSRGFGCVRNNAQAVECFERAGNHVGALYDLGIMFDNGLGVAKDYAHAAVLYRLAAEQSFSLAQHNIARVYEFGDGVPKDLQQAKHWYTLAAQQGQEQAQEALRHFK